MDVIKVTVDLIIVEMLEVIFMYILIDLYVWV